MFICEGSGHSSFWPCQDRKYCTPTKSPRPRAWASPPTQPFLAPSAPAHGLDLSLPVRGQGRLKKEGQARAAAPLPRTCSPSSSSPFPVPSCSTSACCNRRPERPVDPSSVRSVPFNSCRSGRGNTTIRGLICRVLSQSKQRRPLAERMQGGASSTKNTEQGTQPLDDLRRVRHRNDFYR